MRFRNIKVGNYEVIITPQEYDWARLFYFWNLAIPYFWDSPISFDMLMKTIKGNIRKPLTPWKYKWKLYELWGSDNLDKLEDAVIKQGDGEYSFEHNSVMRTIRKSNAIRIGYLKPHMNYLLCISFTDDLNHMYDEIESVTFTIKDRDEYQMQIFLILFSICMTILFGFIVKIWGIV